MKKFIAALAVITALTTGLTIARAQAPAPPPAQDTPAKASGVAGKWHFVLDTEGGDRELDAEFTVDSNGKVTGTFGKSAVAGTYLNGKLDLAFQFTSEEVGMTDQMALVGKLDDTAALTGNWQFSTYDGTFKATRPK